MTQSATTQQPGAISEPILGKRVMTRREIWWQSPAIGQARYFMPGAWYWQDEDCEEPMGPFESRAEAVDDYREMRGLSRTARSPSSDSGASR